MAKKNGKVNPTGTEVRTGKAPATDMACAAKPEKRDTTTTMDGGC
ncbi:MAG: hypothetical protein ACUVTU_13040 [Desulfurispora sp.]